MKRKKFAGSKKGSFFVPLTVFGAIIALISLLTILLLKSENLDAKSLGEKHLDLFRLYQSGEKHLYFVDSAARKAIEGALLYAGKNGLQGDNKCGMYGDKRLWTRQYMDSSCSVVSESCYPKTDLDSQGKYFSGIFKDYFKPYIDDYNSYRDRDGLTGDIPKDYESFKLEEKYGALQFIGFAKNPVVITDYLVKKGVATGRPLAEYKVKPSFTLPLTQNFIEDGKYMVAKIPQIQATGPNAAQLTAAMSQFNSENQKLKWSLDGNKIDEVPATPCQHNLGTCTYECKCVTVTIPVVGSLIGDLKVFCQTCTGTTIETVSYKNKYAPISVDTGKTFYTYSVASKKVEPMSLAYKFGLGWITETGRSTRCAHTEGN